MAFLTHFLVILVLGLVVDRAAYSGLKSTAESFWPLGQYAP
ncbi:MAG: hypothetical protein AVDCRST_MAG93-1153 [uncultured Chloroflexia bacterium]|uniref:Uncharacterized protein n=1 Tax=uncultured Chloroflexia bacterium TaxID=1672391 RepID=A0A6J4I1B1_9CHLR|nr:MAG: hypothetical protein AVDCRST_MAG93-1153 [uncultured Chloroflexia bacterium]